MFQKFQDYYNHNHRVLQYTIWSARFVGLNFGGLAKKERNLKNTHLRDSEFRRLWRSTVVGTGQLRNMKYCMERGTL